MLKRSGERERAKVETPPKRGSGNRCVTRSGCENVSAESVVAARKRETRRGE